MSGTRKSDETWLVVASTGAAAVNLVAAAVTGLEQYDRILFLTGENAENRGNARRIEAQRGFDRLLGALEFEARRQRLKWRPPEPNELFEDMNDPAPWPGRLAEFFGPSGPGVRARRIVYVYTGGTTDMKLGCWEGFVTIRNQRPDITIEFVSKQERRVFWPKEPHRTVPLAGGANHVSVESYLLASGYQIVNGDECVRRRRVARKHAEALRALGDILLRREQARRHQWVKLLNCLSGHSRVEVSSIAEKHRLSRVDVQAFCESLQPLVHSLSDGACTFYLSNGRWMFRRQVGVPQQLFQGDWFEDWLYLRTSDALKNTRAEVTHGLEIIRLGAATNGSDNEIDLAILANDQLYIAEAKTSAPSLNRKDEKKDAKAEISKLSALRKQVVGPARIGAAWLICAEPLADDAARREIAEHQDVEIIAGGDEIERFIAKLPEIVA